MSNFEAPPPRRQPHEPTEDEFRNAMPQNKKRLEFRVGAFQDGPLATEGDRVVAGVQLHRRSGPVEGGHEGDVDVVVQVQIDQGRGGGEEIRQKEVQGDRQQQEEVVEEAVEVEGEDDLGRQCKPFIITLD